MNGSLFSRLANLGGLKRNGAKYIASRARALHLPFQELAVPAHGIWWQSGLALQRLADLPRDALSGPVQEDKSEARTALMRVVEHQSRYIETLDLRRVDGLGGAPDGRDEFATLEAFAASAHCRHIRIISYRDFLKTINQALPRFLAGEIVPLRRAEWLGKRLFWAGEQQMDSFACAIVYARRRGLDVSLPAELQSYRLSPKGLGELNRRYHVLAMPSDAWSDPAFMGLLLDGGLPYSRLSLRSGADAPDFLLLPKRDGKADALGEGLRQAGATDFVAYLLQRSIKTRG
jgi:hypothetical protein